MISFQLDSSKGAQYKLVDKDECQTGITRTGCAAKECWTGKWEHAAEERTSRTKATSIEYKASTEAKLEEARIREEKLIQSNEDFKREMKKQSEETNRIMKQQSEETNRMMKQMMEMFQKQAQP